MRVFAVFVLVILFGSLAEGGTVSGTIRDLAGGPLSPVNFQVTARSAGRVVGRGGFVQAGASEFQVTIQEGLLPTGDSRVTLEFSGLGRQTVVLNGVSGFAIATGLDVVMPEDDDSGVHRCRVCRPRARRFRRNGRARCSFFE